MLFWHISNCKVQQSNFITKFDRFLLQSASGITKCDRLYYKVRQVLQSVTVITRWDVTLVYPFKWNIYRDKKNNRRNSISISSCSFPYFRFLVTINLSKTYVIFFTFSFTLQKFLKYFFFSNLTLSLYTITFYTYNFIEFIVYASMFRQHHNFYKIIFNVKVFSI